MKIHLVDGTYELFRNYYGAPPKKSADGLEVGATLGMLRSMLLLLGQPEVSHVGVAFDHVIESFRNDLFDGYKTGEGVEAELLGQFPLAEEAVSALGLAVWSMIEFEADDAIATATVRFEHDPRVEQIVICSPDKDLAQLVRGDHVVSWDRRRDIFLNEAGVVEKFGVPPASIPDWLALVGDSADGYPGVKGWGAKSASAVLARFGHIDAIPASPEDWHLDSIGLGRARKLAESLALQQTEAALYRRLAELRTDVPFQEQLEDLEWRGAQERLRALCERLGEHQITDRIPRWQ